MQHIAVCRDVLRFCKKSMSPIEQFNLTWLEGAMTDLPDSNKSYYYDGKNGRFFHVEEPADRDLAIEFYDTTGLSITDKEYRDLFIRLEINCNPDNEIMEIARLYKAQKIDIQLQFLDRFGEKKYWATVLRQQGAGPFRLNELMTKPENILLNVRWKMFKMEVIRHYIQSFSQATGIQIHLHD
jgi:hypothetical protein